jgi:hypothetical protein
MDIVSFKKILCRGICLFLNLGNKFLGARDAERIGNKCEREEGRE